MNYFSVVRANPNEPYDIIFEVDSSINPLTEDAQSLYVDIENTLTIIKNLVKTDSSTKEKYFNKLVSLSQAAFVSGGSTSIELAIGSLEILKNEMLKNEGQRIKNHYMATLGTAAIISIIICWVIYGLLYWLFEIPKELQIYFVVWTGAMAGVWVSFGARKFNIMLTDLIRLEEDNMSVYIRLPYIGVCALILLLFFNSDLFNMSIGSTSIKENIQANIETQVLFGVIAGLLESKLGLKIYEKANNVTNEVNN